MTEDKDAGERPEDPIYLIEMREHEGRTEIAIVSVPRGPAASDASKDVWGHQFGSLKAARVVMQVMMACPDRWPVWARMAVFLGKEFLTGLIEAEVLQARDAAARTEEAAGAGVRRREAMARRAEFVEVSLVLSGRPRIIATHEGRSFMVIIRDTVSEARRLWDWIRWQTDSLQAWFHLARRYGSPALERFILGSMRAAEESVKAAGLAADGDRPLRDWRPADPASGNCRDREGPKRDDDGDGPRQE